MSKERQKYELLRILIESQDSIGASTLCQMLKCRNLNVSSATVGRILNEFDFEGLTVRLGYKGRILTDLGREQFLEYRRKMEFEEFSAKLYEAVNETDPENLINILVARRGIEREIAKLAAEQATKEDLAEIRAAYQIHFDSVKSKKHRMITSENDVFFHRAVAKASKNIILASTYDFIWQNGRLSPIMEYVRISVGGAIAVDHGRILAAIEAGDPEQAQEMMTVHIDSLINDVNKYWQTKKRATRGE
ncbi:MAG: FCD domain-containing protein [Candidatus Adiutrix sp.]|jgi:GntR family L-lactate dehydrogenase operon transcriptional regulator|nr:FCD domain-containing protein [Candidatus Adiutrix sp.]